MGIKNLNSILKNFNIFPKKHIKDIQLSIVAVDFSLFLYRFIYNQNNPVECFLRQIILFFKNNILPVYVIDGTAPSEKSIILSKRAMRRNKVNEELEKLLDLKQRLIDNNSSPRKLSILEQDINKLEKKCVQFSKEIVKNLIDFFEMCGIPVIQENYESDWILAQLSKNKLVDYVLSEDSDLLVFGAEKIMKNFCILEESFNIYERQKILDSLHIEQTEFIDLCILAGCDYAPKIKNINTVKALELISENKKIENIKDIDYEIESINLARNIFKREIDNELIKVLSEKICKKNFQFNKIEKFLLDNLDKKFLIPLFTKTCRNFVHYKQCRRNSSTLADFFKETNV